MVVRTLTGLEHSGELFGYDINDYDCLVLSMFFSILFGFLLEEDIDGVSQFTFVKLGNISQVLKATPASSDHVPLKLAPFNPNNVCNVEDASLRHARETRDHWLAGITEEDLDVFKSLEKLFSGSCHWAPNGVIYVMGGSVAIHPPYNSSNVKSVDGSTDIGMVAKRLEKYHNERAKAKALQESNNVD